MKTRSQIKKELDSIPKTLNILLEEKANKTFGDYHYPESYDTGISYMKGWKDALMFVLDVCHKCESIDNIEEGCRICRECRKDWKRLYE